MALDSKLYFGEFKPESQPNFTFNVGDNKTKIKIEKFALYVCKVENTTKSFELALCGHGKNMFKEMREIQSSRLLGLIDVSPENRRALIHDLKISKTNDALKRIRMACLTPSSRSYVFDLGDSIDQYAEPQEKIYDHTIFLEHNFEEENLPFANNFECRKIFYVTDRRSDNWNYPCLVFRANDIFYSW